MRIQPARQTAGFTLIELIIVLTILVISIGLIIPGFGRLLDSSQQSASVNTFSTALAQARYHAVTHSQRVVLCPSLDQQHCTGGYDWQAGFITFIDKNLNRLPDEDEDIINISQATSHVIDIQTSKGRSRITFRPTGDAPGSNTTFRFCPKSANLQRKVLVLSNTGRVRLSEKMPDGSEISCI